MYCLSSTLHSALQLLRLRFRWLLTPSLLLFLSRFSFRFMFGFFSSQPRFNSVSVSFVINASLNTATASLLRWLSDHCFVLLIPTIKYHYCTKSINYTSQIKFSQTGVDLQQFTQRFITHLVFWFGNPNTHICHHKQILIIMVVVLVCLLKSLLACSVPPKSNSVHGATGKNFFIEPNWSPITTQVCHVINSVSLIKHKQIQTRKGRKP